MIPGETYEKFLSRLLSGDRAACVSITDALLKQGADVREIYVDLFQKSLYRVGELWENNRISVSVEHMATSIIESLFTLVYPVIFSAEHTGKKAVVSCVANEFHQVGGKMVADIFELNGWDGYFLGANVPREEMLRFIDEKKPDVLGLSLSIYSQMKTLIDVMESVRSVFPRLDMIIGGQAFRWGGRELVARISGTTYIESLEVLEKMIKGNTR